MRSLLSDGDILSKTLVAAQSEAQRWASLGEKLLRQDFVLVASCKALESQIGVSDTRLRQWEKRGRIPRRYLWRRTCWYDATGWAFHISEAWRVVAEQVLWADCCFLAQQRLAIQEPHVAGIRAVDEWVQAAAFAERIQTATRVFSQHGAWVLSADGTHKAMGAILYGRRH